MTDTTWNEAVRQLEAATERREVSYALVCLDVETWDAYEETREAEDLALDRVLVLEWQRRTS